jgi:hypothetical protein
VSGAGQVGDAPLEDEAHDRLDEEQEAGDDKDARDDQEDLVRFTGRSGLGEEPPRDEGGDAR